MSPSYVVRSDVGRVRERNEDMAQVDARRGLYLLADGMGGHPDGHVASAVAIEAAMGYLTARVVPGRSRKRATKLIQAIEAANQAILARSQLSDGSFGMGTTLVCLWLGSRQACVAHVGDSRVYLFRKGKLSQLTRDHTVVQALIERGELKPGDPEALRLGHILTQAVGLDGEIHPECSQLAIFSGDVFLLCSDGLSDFVSEEILAAILAATPDVEKSAKQLVDAALNVGGLDNITVVLVKVDKGPKNITGK